MDFPPVPPASSENVIEQRLVDCGLNRQGFQVSYVDEFQSIEIVITETAGATPEQFPCIHNATMPEIVTFKSSQLSAEYNDFTNELYQPIMLQSAEKELGKLGLLEGFPLRASFANEQSFAEALEVHCGLETGSALHILEGVITLQPSEDAIQDFDHFQAKYGCLIAAIMYVSARDNYTVGFIGNEAFTESEGD